MPTEPTSPAPRQPTRWCGYLSPQKGSMPRGKVQLDHYLRDVALDRTGLTLPEGVLRLAHAEYEAQYGRQQDYERMQERGGLSVLEVIGLLADHVERLGGKPTKPREAT